MPTKVADEPKCESVTEAQSVESCMNMECTIEPSDEFLQVFQLSCTFSTNKSNSGNTKQIKTIETKMDKLYRKVINSRNATLNDIITLAYSYQNICHGYIKKENLRIGRDYILRCLSLVKGKELGAKSILIALKGHFQLGFIYFKQKKTGKAIQTCNRAVGLYLTYTHENEKYGNPIHFGDSIIKSPPDGYYLLNVIYKDILKLLIDVNTNIDDHNLMVYNHLLLAVELNTLQETGNYFQWIDVALKICQYLLKRGRFAEARSHIITAVYVKNIFFHERSHNVEFSSEKPEMSELHCDNMFIMIWLKLATNFFRMSAERLLRLEKDEEFEINNLKSGHTTKFEGDTISQRLLLFNDVDTGIQFPNLFIPVKYISHYNDAYKLFINILKNVSFVRFCLDQRDLRNYTRVILGFCKAYKYMALFEKDLTKLSLLQNRLVDILLEIVENKKFLSYPDKLKRIRFNLALSYSTLINVKLENLDAIHPLYMPERHNAITLEIQCLVRNALTNLKMIL